MIHFSKKTATLSLALAAITLFSGCATTTSPEARSAYDKTQQSLKSQPVSIVSDGCLIRVEMGKNDILYQQSDATSVAMMHTVEEALVEKGLRVTRTTAPFVCGTQTKEVLTKMDILTTADSKDVLNTDYPILSADNTFDGLTNQAYLNLFQALDSDTRKMAEKSKGASVDLGLDKNSLDLIRKLEDTDKVFVSMVTGSKPSFGYSMAMGVTTAVATGGTGFATPKTGQVHGLYLVNLKTNQIEMGKETPFATQVFKMPIQERLAYKGLLAPLYDN
ncbi:hypothetical protein QO189_12125 [Psychrobacter sp. Arc29]|uniref:hypothetical protein n=1 Tax=Psychrobacter sp. Arc29 TaxID=3046690 RepID=UPI00352C28BA